MRGHSAIGVECAANNSGAWQLGSDSSECTSHCLQSSFVTAVEIRCVRASPKAELKLVYEHGVLFAQFMHLYVTLHSSHVAALIIYHHS